jgi:predicted transcriptional regulator
MTKRRHKAKTEVSELVAARVPHALIQRLDRIQTQRKCSRSYLIITGIETVVAREEKKIGELEKATL